MIVSPSDDPALPYHTLPYHTEAGRFHLERPGRVSLSFFVLRVSVWAVLSAPKTETSAKDDGGDLWSHNIDEGGDCFEEDVDPVLMSS